MPRPLLLASFFWLIYWPAQSQNVPTDTSQLRFWGQRWQTEYAQQRRYADSLAQARGLLTFYADSTTTFELQAFDALGQPRYFQTHNQGAALTHRVTALLPGGSSGLALDGSGQTVGIWDGGAVRPTHTEFGQRVVFGDSSSQQAAAAASFSNHATHVAGTVGAAGMLPAARGMAPAVALQSYDWNSDLSEVSAAAANGLLVSNHSYGFRTGWSFNPGLGR